MSASVAKLEQAADALAAAGSAEPARAQDEIARMHERGALLVHIDQAITRMRALLGEDSGG